MSVNLFRNEPGRRTVKAGEVIFSAGDHADHFYGVVEGSVQLEFDGEIREVVEPGGVFGEVGLLADRIRTGTARAQTDVVVAKLDEAAFLRLVKLNAFFSLQVMREMARRLEGRDSHTVTT